MWPIHKSIAGRFWRTPAAFCPRASATSNTKLRVRPVNENEKQSVVQIKVERYKSLKYYVTLRGATRYNRWLLSGGRCLPREVRQTLTTLKDRSVIIETFLMQSALLYINHAWGECRSGQRNSMAIRRPRHLAHTRCQAQYRHCVDCGKEKECWQTSRGPYSALCSWPRTVESPSRLPSQVQQVTGSPNL